MSAIISSDGAAQRMAQDVNAGGNLIQPDCHHKLVDFVSKTSKAEIIAIADLRKKKK